MSGYDLFSNITERIPYATESKHINTDPSGDFTIINNELVLQDVDPTALNTQLLTIDGAGLVSWKDEALLPANPAAQNVVDHSAATPSTITIGLINTEYDWTSANGGLSIFTFGANFTGNDATGEATLSGLGVPTLYVKVEFSASLRLVSGTNETFIIRCVGNAVAGPVTTVFGAGEVTLKNSSDLSELTFVSLVPLSNTGYYKFTFENITGADDLELSFAQAVMIV